MISHEHKCIFLHIPRTGGTSIEHWLNGGPVDPATQHLLPSQARELYADYWDDYFKFSFVRHPVARVLSCLAYPDEFGLRRDGNDIMFSDYHRRFGVNPVVEYDYRFGKAPKLKAPQPNTIYGNMLDLPLDFIGRTEDMVKHTGIIRDILGVEKPFDDHYRYEVSVIQQDWNLSDATFDHIEAIYDDDYDRFFYKRRGQM